MQRCVKPLGCPSMRYLLDSITDARADHAGGVAISGSHGGIYPATVASRAGLHAVILNDAGIGFERAGVAGLAALERCGMAAAAADCMSCQIGAARDTDRGGIISVANAQAAACGVVAGMSVADAAARLAGAPAPHAMLPAMAETRREVRLQGCPTPVILLDSASLVGPDDVGGIVVTGSHGGLIGGDPARALKARARVAVFNDAGIGRGRIGTTRLPALDRIGVAAVTVGHDSARIGDAASAVETGVISAANDTATGLGARVGVALSDWLRGLGPLG